MRLRSVVQDFLILPGTFLADSFFLPIFIPLLPLSSLPIFWYPCDFSDVSPTVPAKGVLTFRPAQLSQLQIATLVSMRARALALVRQQVLEIWYVVLSFLFPKRVLKERKMILHNYLDACLQSDINPCSSLEAWTSVFPVSKMNQICCLTCYCFGLKTSMGQNLFFGKEITRVISLPMK